MTSTPGGGSSLSNSSLPSLLLAFALAPFAGSLTAGAVGTILAAAWRLGLGPWRLQVAGESLGDRIGGAVGIGILTAFVAFCIALFGTVLVGGIITLRHRKRSKPPSRTAMLGCALFAGVMPFAASLLLGVPPEFTTKGGPGVAWGLVFVLAVAAAASL